MFNAQLVAALPDGCSSLHQEGVGFFPPSIEQKFVDKTTFGDTEIFNAQLVAALPDGCSSLHREGVGFFSPQVLNRNLVTIPLLVTLKCSTAQLVAALPDGRSNLHQEGVGVFSPKY